MDAKGKERRNEGVSKRRAGGPSMSAIRRARLYLLRKKGKSLGLCVFILVVATLMLACLAIQSATQTADANLKKALLGYFTVNAKTVDGGIPQFVVDDVLEIDGLTGAHDLRSYTYASYSDAQGAPLSINTQGAAQVPEGYETAGKVVANSSSQAESYFSDGVFEMVEGDPIEGEGAARVLVHEDFASRNGLAIGEKMTLSPVGGEGSPVEATVSGIFTNVKAQDSIGVAPSYDLYDNIVFTDTATASALLYGSKSETGFQYGDFYVDDPEELDRIMDDVRSIAGMDWESCTLTRYDNENAKASLQGLQGVVSIAMASVTVVCFVVLALFLTLRFRGRIRETGAYLAMGVTKGSVLAQYLVEVAAVAALALVLSFGISSAIAQHVGSGLLSQVSAEGYETIDLSGEGGGERSDEGLGLESISVEVSPGDFALVGVSGIALCLGSTALAAAPVLRMKPKRILALMG